MSSLDKNDAFTIIWKIQNFSMIPEMEVCEAEDALYTPTLMVDMLDKTNWYLSLSSEDNHGDKSLLCTLYREDIRPFSITINYSIEIVSINSSKLNGKIGRKVFDHNDVIEYSLGKLDDIYNKKDILLPNDILTVQCCMWKSGACNSPKSTTEQKVAVENSKSDSNKEGTGQGKKLKFKTLINHVYAQNVEKLDPKLSTQMYLSAKECLKGFTKNLLPNKCVVRTQIELERRSILWTIEKFSEIEPGQRIFIPVLPTKQGDTPLILAFYLVEDVEGDTGLRIDIQRDREGSPIFIKRAITILNAECEDQDCIQDTRLLSDPDTWHLTLTKKNKLLGEYNYLTNDTLLLRCEFAISRYSNNFTVEVIISFPESHSTADESDSSDWEKDLKKELSRIHQKADFCDIVLKVGQQSFCAHKIVLCASSAYFRDLFINDDFEELKVEIVDCEPSILEKLLKYMYSGVLEKMGLADLLKCYSAASRFRVASLKRLCSFELRASLNVFNVCDVLNVADLQKDQLLMAAVRKFISEFSNEVLHSSKWKLLMESNPKLTGKVMHEVLTNKYTL